MSTGAAVQLATDAPEETRRLAAASADAWVPNDVIGLTGTLGAGKTCFVKGLARGLGVDDLRQVISPTFVLLRRYVGRLPLHHFDAYRLRDASEMEEIGCAELFEAGGLSVVEWADHVAGCLPPEHFLLDIRVTEPTRRRFHLTASVPALAERLEALRHALAPWRA